MQLKLTGGKELNAALKELGGQISNRLGANAARAGGREVVKAARARVPVKTGSLKRSIRVFSGTKRKQGEISVQVGTDVFYGRFLEFGTARQVAKPFLRPAADEQQQQVLDRVSQNLWRGVERAAAKAKK